MINVDRYLIKNPERHIFLSCKVTIIISNHARVVLEIFRSTKQTKCFQKNLKNYFNEASFTQICLHIPPRRSEMGVKVVVEQRLDLHVDVRLQRKMVKNRIAVSGGFTRTRPVE